jgi:hypothetical protein
MSGRSFAHVLAVSEFSAQDRHWFPKWYARFEDFLRETRQTADSVDRQTVIEFSRTLLASGTSSILRLQAVRAVASYYALVRKQPVADLEDVMQTLSRQATQAQQFGPDDVPGVADEPQLVGRIDSDEPAIIKRMRREMRVRGLMLRTEVAYVGWVRRFLSEHGRDSAVLTGEDGDTLPPESAIREFLTSLAVEGNVAASTQTQAKSGLIFLYQKVFGRQLGYIDAVPAKKPERLPVVFSHAEVGQLLPLFTSLKRLMFLVLYGAGLRHLECRRLRVKDICFDEGHIVVRNGKGNKDRITVLPDRCRDELRNQILRVQVLHREDLETGDGRVYLPYALERKYPRTHPKVQLSILAISVQI